VGQQSAAKVGQPIPAELNIGYVLIGLLNRPINGYVTSGHRRLGAAVCAPPFDTCIQIYMYHHSLISYLHDYHIIMDSMFVRPIFAAQSLRQIVVSVAKVSPKL